MMALEIRRLNSLNPRVRINTARLSPGLVTPGARTTIAEFTEEGSMSKILTDGLEANKKYCSSFGEKGKLAVPPARGFAVLTCMGPRLDPAKYAGLAEGDAHIIRTAGGRASDDAIRSLVISYKLLGTSEFFVIHHTNCGMLY